MLLPLKANNQKNLACIPHIDSKISTTKFRIQVIKRHHF